MRAVLAIAGKDLRQRMRDRSAVVLGFVAPLVIATLMGFALGRSESFHADLVLVDEDDGPVSTAFAAMLADPELADLVSVRGEASPEAARAAVADGTAGAAVVLPAGLSDAVHDGGAVELQVLSSVDSQLAGEVAASLARSFTVRLNAAALRTAAAAQAGAGPARAAAAAAEQASRDLPLRLERQSAGTRPMKAISYYSPAMAIFFVLFAVSFSARSFFSERRSGTLDRLAAAPVPAGAILAGKGLSTFVYAVGSMTTMVVTSSLLLGAYWGPPFPVAALVVTQALVVVALAAVVTALARSESQAEGLSSIITFGLVLLGGNFVFIWAAPEALRRLALLTPNGWALRAFTDMSTGSAAWTSTAPAVGYGLAFAAAAGVLAGLLSRRAVQR